MDLSISSHLTTYIPVVAELVEKGINMFEKPGDGVAKTAAVLDFAETSVKAILPNNHTAQDVAQLLGYAKKIIPTIVENFNKLGLFFKSSTPVPTQLTPEPLPPAPAARPAKVIRDEIKKLQDQIARLDPVRNKKKVANKTARVGALREELKVLKAA